jgi:hypothetical protein
MKSTPQTCHGCTHLYVTYDPATPWGCRAHAFKSRQMPYVIVKGAVGTDCAAFEQGRFIVDKPAGRKTGAKR